MLKIPPSAPTPAEMKKNYPTTLPHVLETQSYIAPSDLKVEKVTYLNCNVLANPTPPPLQPTPSLKATLLPVPKNIVMIRKNCLKAEVRATRKYN